MIMTGTDHHIAGLGNLIEWTNISGQNDPSGKGSTAPQRGEHVNRTRELASNTDCRYAGI
jgi:arylsulfatase